VHQLVHDLTGQAPEAFPTCALAVIDLPGAWAGVRPGLGTLRTVRTPKD
jgi:phosphohistidine phosphatase